jgi:DNA replication and repair protein RecF
VFTASPAHLDRVRDVRRILDQKLATLRAAHPDPGLLDVLDEQLARAGAELVDRRARLLAELEPHLVALHRDIAGGVGELTVEILTHARGADPVDRAEALRERLRSVRERELDRRTALAGPQLDDVRIGLDGRPARDFASRGQIRSIVLALKLAEMVAGRARGEVPLFLIDDVSSELDADRTGRLVARLADLGAQVFATTTDPGPMCAALPGSATLVVGVEQGVLGPVRPDR